MNIDKLTDKEKMELFKNGELNFSSQDDKIKTINEIVEIMENMISKHENNSEITTLMMFKVIKYFLEEHRDVLEQYELDYDDE